MITFLAGTMFLLLPFSRRYMPWSIRDTLSGRIPFRVLSHPADLRRGDRLFNGRRSFQKIRSNAEERLSSDPRWTPRTPYPPNPPSGDR